MVDNLCEITPKHDMKANACLFHLFIAANNSPFGIALNFKGIYNLQSLKIEFCSDLFSKIRLN